MGSLGVRTCALSAHSGRTLDRMRVERLGVNRKFTSFRAVKGFWGFLLGLEAGSLEQQSPGLRMDRTGLDSENQHVDYQVY